MLGLFLFRNYKSYDSSKQARRQNLESAVVHDNKILYHNCGVKRRETDLPHQNNKLKSSKNQQFSGVSEGSE